MSGGKDNNNNTRNNHEFRKLPVIRDDDEGEDMVGKFNFNETGKRKCHVEQKSEDSYDNDMNKLNGDRNLNSSSTSHSNLNGNLNRVTCLSKISNDIIMCGNQNGMIKIWNVNESCVHQAQQLLLIHQDGVQKSISPQGLRLKKWQSWA